jgi:hypothetical protein
VGHHPEVALGHRLSAVDGFELKDAGLEIIGREEQQVEELSHPRSSQPEPPSDCGPVGTESPVDGPWRWCDRVSIQAMCARRQVSPKRE